jgi:hypothetical protein
MSEDSCRADSLQNQLRMACFDQEHQRRLLACHTRRALAGNPGLIYPVGHSEHNENQIAAQKTLAMTKSLDGHCEEHQRRSNPSLQAAG